LVRERLKIIFHGDKNGKLTVGQEALAGVIGGKQRRRRRRRLRRKKARRRGRRNVYLRWRSRCMYVMSRYDKKWSDTRGYIDLVSQDLTAVVVERSRRTSVINALFRETHDKWQRTFYYKKKPLVLYSHHYHQPPLPFPPSLSLCLGLPICHHINRDSGLLEPSI